MDDYLGFDPTEYYRLPDPGGFMPLKASPCPDCVTAGMPGTDWQIVRYMRTLRYEDGTSRTIPAVDCQCPEIYRHKREEPPRSLEVLGSFDVTTGTATLRKSRNDTIDKMHVGTQNRVVRKLISPIVN